ncbi:luminal-binding protein 2-like [Setaria italica]|uniref:luminal-binding protein 2-like n=1 Tax=Setaria italica TaxID=4555 RepID=UPI000BE53EC7|nr:luminal-binding protein 2-like [Setaria italica]
MVREAEEFAEEDKKMKVKEKLDARNQLLDTYVYNMKNAIGDKDKLLADKLDCWRARRRRKMDEDLEWPVGREGGLRGEAQGGGGRVQPHHLISAVYQTEVSGGVDDHHDEL